MSATYTPIASITVGTASAIVTFSSIPQTYTDLVIIGSLGSTVDSSNLLIRFNSDTATNYSNTTMLGNGTTTTSNRYSNQSAIYQIERMEIADTASTYSVSTININNYSNTTTYKSTLSRSNTPNGNVPGVDLVMGMWRSTAAITSIALSTNIGSFSVGSTFNLYGILAGS
jgi:hypothetical protein